MTTNDDCAIGIFGPQPIANVDRLLHKGLSPLSARKDSASQHNRFDRSCLVAICKYRQVQNCCGSRQIPINRQYLRHPESSLNTPEVLTSDALIAT